MSSIPKITVLMPVYNCELYIKEAVDSILNQTFSDFEFIIIDDASSDATVSIIKAYDDPRIQLIQKPQNSGYTNSLNHGLTIAKGEYIARMDGDDISLPERFAKQVDFLDTNLDVVLCGTLYQVIGEKKVCDHPLIHDEIKVKLISGCYIAHPTIMFVKAKFDEHKLAYDSEMEPAEDYELWSRLVFLEKTANIGQVLLYYRVHNQQVSRIRNEKQIKVAHQVRITMLQKVIPQLDKELYFFDIQKQGLNLEFILKKLKRKVNLLDSLILINGKKGIYEHRMFLQFINNEKKRLYKLYQERDDVYSFTNVCQILIIFPLFFKKVGLKKTGKFVIKSIFYKKNKK
ncbi:glycosyltransferase family 2 protein [Flavobacterium psychroterrae]|uniref:Glycosyltransferase family 2 protein n=1 Tax=Flavobacterium psychroterrae TaxID=2133767 RepID=A0ABS5PC74_9FLAO|nr:glycosyltransferase family 2 protein [Flavobacterium psychroterrae]MBS7231902.1 glycosyltransferase family 2 protein [Flavobacterium psychroterrae]